MSSTRTPTPPRVSRSEAQHMDLEGLLMFALDKVRQCARLDDETIARLDRLATTMAERARIAVDRTDATRAAIERGIEVLERELGIAGKTPTVPALPTLPPMQAPEEWPAPRQRGRSR